MSIFDLFKKKTADTADYSEAPTISETAEETSETAKNEKSEKPTVEKKISSEEIRRVFNLIILDESGSMSSIYQPALTGVNETLHTIREAQKEHGNQKHFASLIAFDSGHYNTIYHKTPAEEAIDITSEQYRPGGCTPLYDAMGRAITELRPEITEGDVVLVTIITDGYENASREYNGKAIKALVEQMKAKGWVFTYIGANQDVEAVATSMSIDNSLAFDADEESTGAMFEKECRSRKKFFGKLSRNMPMCDLSVGYFDEDDEDEKDKF